MPYAAYVNKSDAVYISDFGSNSPVFDHTKATVEFFSISIQVANVRQMLGDGGVGSTQHFRAEGHGTDKIVSINDKLLS